MTITFTRGKNSQGNLFWLADNFTGLIIERKKDHSGWFYSVKQYGHSGSREIASFDTKVEAETYVKGGK